MDNGYTNIICTALGLCYGNHDITVSIMNTWRLPIGRFNRGPPCVNYEHHYVKCYVHIAFSMEDTGMPFTSDGIGILTPESATTDPPLFESVKTESTSFVKSESFKDQIHGFAEPWAELMTELGKACKDVVQQTLSTKGSYIVKKTKGPLNLVSGKLRFLNEFSPEICNPVHAWSVIFFVFILANFGGFAVEISC